MEQDSSKQEFWNERYAAGRTPWDFRGVQKQTTDYIGTAKPGRVLIPGCGSGYEVAAFHHAGWDVLAIDFSPVAIQRARGLLGPLGERVVEGDFFEYPFADSSFDLVFERTFLCALSPTKWPEYAARMRRLIRPGGKLAGLFFHGENPHPPPHPISESQAIELFGHHFTLTQDEPAGDSLPIFGGKERWKEWTLAKPI